MDVTADTIRQARTRLGEHQEAFAKRFGVHQSTVSGWETDGPPQRGPVRMLIERVLSDLPADETPSTAPSAQEPDQSG